VKYGYARVSTEDQNAAMQHAALKKDRCTKIFTDELPGGSTKRPALLRCLKTLQRGDSLTVWKLDRLGRSLRDLISTGVVVEVHRWPSVFSLPRSVIVMAVIPTW
jgi:DNA invertase Pin-like site-specific DNA recombinase